MKSYTRFLALVLVLIMTVSAFVGCGSGDPTTDGTADNKSEQETGEYMPDIEKKNYNEEFYLNILPDVNPTDFYWVKEASDSVLSNALYNRQENVRKYLGVEVIGVATDGENRYVEPFKNAVMNKDGSVDTLISHVYYGIDGFISGNYLTDIQDIPEIDVYADYWKYDVMEDISANGHFYLGFSDLNIFYTHVITFNKTLLAKYADQLDEDLYATVENYRWTLDKMISVAKLAYADAQADGKSDDDTFGFVSSTEYIGYAGMIQGFGIKLVSQNAKGDYVMSCYTEENKQKMSDIVDKLYNLVRSEFAYMPKDKNPSPTMGNNRALMTINGTYWLSNLLSTGVDFGVLPYPMYDEAQKTVGYRHLQWGGYLALPSYLKNPDMVYETMELLAYFSEDVNIAYYEKLLGKKVADAPQDRLMLDMVWDSVCSDFGLTYSTVMNAPFQWVLSITKPNSTMGLASYMAQYEGKAAKTLKKFMERIK